MSDAQAQEPMSLEDRVAAAEKRLKQSASVRRRLLGAALARAWDVLVEGGRL